MTTRTWLLLPRVQDRPRRIDRFIDYFGEGVMPAGRPHAGRGPSRKRRARPR